MSDFIVLVPFMYLLLATLLQEPDIYKRNQSHLYIKQTMTTKTMTFYFQILTLLLFNLGQVMKTPFIPLVLFLSISLMSDPEKFIMV